MERASHSFALSHARARFVVVLGPRGGMHAGWLVGSLTSRAAFRSSRNHPHSNTRLRSMACRSSSSSSSSRRRWRRRRKRTCAMVAVVVSVRACVGLCRRRKGVRVWGSKEANRSFVRSSVVRSGRRHSHCRVRFLWCGCAAHELLRSGARIR